MKNPKLLIAGILVFLFWAPAILAQHATDVYSPEYAREIVNILTQKKYKGRKAGKKASRPVIGYIAGEFEKSGCGITLQPIYRDSLAEAIGAPRKGRYPKTMTNIIARIEGKDTSSFVIIGAHFDHLGKSWALGKIHPGADDNASGVAALLSLAKMIHATGRQPGRTVLFCAWDGEEKGMLGSRYYVSKWYEQRERNPLRHGKDTICYYMNFDMVGRTATPDTPAVTFAWNNNYPQLAETCRAEAKKIPVPFQVLYDERTGNGKGGSDYAPFSAHNIPFAAWMEDLMHKDYHRPTDTPDKIHWEKLRQTTLLAYHILYEWIWPKEPEFTK